jgi:circadian clock protein KaiC
MSDRVAIQRLPSGVPGLDAVLGGGVPEYSFNVIAGAPGAGKTTLVQQIMFAIARPDRPALYFTVLGEPPLKIPSSRSRTASCGCIRASIAIRW